jgi:hypothetical protein
MMFMVDVATCLTTCTIGSEYNSWQPIVVVVILAVTMLLAIVYMLGRATARKEWEAFVKVEMHSVLVSVIWVVIIAALANFTCQVSCVASKNENPFDVSISYLAGIRDKLETNINFALDAAKQVKIDSASMFAITEAGPYVRMYDGCNVVSGNQEMLGNIVAPFIGSIIAQQFLLMFVSIAAFQVLLPIGVILRIIPFAREAGALLIGIAFALYIILPLMYVMADMASKEVLAKYDKKMQDIGEATWVDGKQCLTPGPLTNNLEAIGYLLPQAVFFPVLAGIITVAAARVFTKVFQYDFKEILQ